MRLISIIFCAFTLAACTGGHKMLKVKFDSLLHDSNSKVWLIDRHVVDGVNIAPVDQMDKKLLIFYADGEFRMIPLKSIGKTTPIVGNYFLNSEEEILELYVQKKSWDLKMDVITEDSIHMHALKSSEIMQDINIVPLPKF